MNKDKSLNEIVEAISLEKGKFLNKIVVSPRKPLLLPKQTQKKIDYSKFFSYIGSGVKASPYIVYEAKKLVNNLSNKKENKGPLNYNEVVDVIKTSKIDRLLGRSTEFINPKLRERFDNFKIFNQQYVMLLYEIVGI